MNVEERKVVVKFLETKCKKFREAVVLMSVMPSFVNLLNNIKKIEEDNARLRKNNLLRKVDGYQSEGKGNYNRPIEKP